MRKETRDRLRKLQIIDDGCSVHLTYTARYAASRKVLAGEQIVQPIELYIYLGGNPDEFDDNDLRECRRHLKVHGYKKDKAVPHFFGELKEMWIRTEKWPEDDYWEMRVNQIKADLEAHIVSLD